MIVEAVEGPALLLAVDRVVGGVEGEGRIKVGQSPGGPLQRGVGAQRLVVVEVLVPQGEGGDPLGEHGLLVVDDEDGVPGVGDGRVEGVEEAEAVGAFAEQQGAGVGGEPPTLEVGVDGLGPEAGKGESFAVPVCPGGGLIPGGIWAVLTQSLHG
jgi:hypothetical protein